MVLVVMPIWVGGHEQAMSSCTWAVLQETHGEFHHEPHSQEKNQEQMSFLASALRDSWLLLLVLRLICFLGELE